MKRTTADYLSSLAWIFAEEDNISFRQMMMSARIEFYAECIGFGWVRENTINETYELTELGKAAIILHKL